MGSKKEKQNPPPPKPEEESSEEEEEEVEEEVEEDDIEGEEEEEVEEEEEPHQKKTQPSSSLGTESASDEDDDDHSTSHPVKRQATPPPETVPNSDDDDDETESDDDGEEEEADPASDSLPSATASAYTVKPIATVPVNSKVSKPTQKRALESSKNDGKGSTDRKKAKTGAENDKKGKGGVFPARVWSEESEIVILQGILNYQREKGPFRHADTGVFYEFIKGKLWDGVTKTQIGDKIKRLKAKYTKNVDKGKNGQDPTFPKAHDTKAYELSKQIWGVGSSVSNGKEERAKTKVVDTGKGGKKVSNAGSETKRVVEDSPKVKVKSEDPKGKKGSNDGSALMDVDVNEGAKQHLGKKDEVKKGDVEGDFMSKFPTLSKSFDVETLFLKDYLHLIGSQNASELEEEWKQLHLEEMNVAAKRVILKGKQTKLVLDAMKKQ